LLGEAGLAAHQHVTQLRLRVKQSNNLTQIVPNDPDRLRQVGVIADHHEGLSIISEGVDE